MQRQVKIVDIADRSASLAQPGGLVRRVNLATGIDQRTGREVHLGRPLDHEDFQPVLAVA